MAKNEINAEQLIDQLLELISDANRLEMKFAAAIKQTHPAFRKSARNLLHYLALRHHDIRELQASLAQLGLSSLGRTESHVLATLKAVYNQLCCFKECKPTKINQVISFAESHKLLAEHTNSLLGDPLQERNSRIMVTFSSDLATDYELVRRIMEAGMNCARINCAHDNEKAWLQMIKNTRRAAKELKLNCKILMDQMGPKLRTGPLKPGPKMLSIHPIRDEQGLIVSPANIWLAPAGARPPYPIDASVPLDEEWLHKLQEGDLLRFLDTRGRKRKLSVVSKWPEGVIVHLFKTSYVATGTKIKLKSKSDSAHVGEIGELLPIEIPIKLRTDDFLILHKESIPGEPAVFDAGGHITRPAHISCTLPEIFSRVKPNQPILFDDGKIEGEIQEVHEGHLLIRITAAEDKGSKLIADKGINLPDSKLNITRITEKDKHDLGFVVKHADIVNLSFVNHPDTVIELQQELEKLRATDLGVMLKIETKEGFKNLPHLLLAAMRMNPAGIMIARGDLAVECGWQRLAEVQEEILWLCEAAHMPVVWATQVLETLAKKGRPSRAEITDAAMAQRADCVMLNKGPHVVQAINMLDKILNTMKEHQHKKTSMLRSLQVSDLDQLPENEHSKK